MAALLVYLLAAMAVSFLCSVLEATLLSTPISYITMREDEGYRHAERLRGYKQDPSRPLAAILSLNTIANTIGAAGVGQQATILFGSQWFGLVSAITTILILVFSEIIPKTIGTTYWKQLSGFVTVTIRVMIIVLFPIVVSVEFLQKLISTKQKSDTSISREEVSAMADVAEESGEIEEDENEIIQNLLNIDEISAKDAMTPRVVAAIAPESMTISFDGSEYSGAYDKTSTYLPHVHDVHKYAGKDIWFHVDSVSGDVVGISFLYEPDNRATITEDECRAKAESIASQYIDIGKYQLEINRTEIYDNYLMKYTYYCEVLGCQTADRLFVTIDGNGKVFAFMKGDVGTVVNQEYKPLSLTML